MIRSHFQAVAMGQFDVTLIALVNTVATLRGLQIDIRHLCVLTYRLPEHLPLIVRQIDAVHMAAGVFTHDIRIVVWIVQPGINRLDDDSTFA